MPVPRRFLKSLLALLLALAIGASFLWWVSRPPQRLTGPRNDPAATGKPIRIAVVWPQLLEGESRADAFIRRSPTIANHLFRHPLFAPLLATRESAAPSFPEGLQFALTLLRESEAAAGASPLAALIELDRFFEPAFSMPHDAVTVATRIAGDPSFSAVLGHYSSPGAISASVVYEKRELLFITPTASMPVLTNHKFHYTFRMTPDDTGLAMAIARFAKHQGYKNIGVFSARSRQGDSLQHRMIEAAGAVGLSIAFTRGYLAGNERFEDLPDFRPLIASTDSETVDAFLIADELPRAAKVILDLRSLGMKQPVIGSDYLDSPRLINLAGQATRDVYVTSAINPDSPDPAYREFKNRFTQRFGAPPSYAASQGFETMTLLYNAIRAANSTDSLAIANRLRTVQSWNGRFDRFRFNARGGIECRDIYIKVADVPSARFSTVLTNGPDGAPTPFVHEPSERQSWKSCELASE